MGVEGNRLGFRRPVADARMLDPVAHEYTREFGLRPRDDGDDLFSGPRERDVESVRSGVVCGFDGGYDPGWGTGTKPEGVDDHVTFITLEAVGGRGDELVSAACLRVDSGGHESALDLIGLLTVRRNDPDGL